VEGIGKREARDESENCKNPNYTYSSLGMSISYQ
jgi:hypothetical protein